MPTISDYIQHNSQKSFEVLPLNEVDIVAINEIGYLSFDQLVEKKEDKPLTIDLEKVLADEAEDSKKLVYNFLMTKERIELFRQMRKSERFKGLSLSYYVNEIDLESEKQFAAMIFEIDAIKHTQIVFRGTDDSLIGWKEDFKLTYMKEVAADRSAISYLSSYLENNPDKEIVVSGHSKGGNLALYASSFLLPNLQKAIKKIYLLDSPGLAEEFLMKEGYQRIRDRLVVIRPQESIVGVMLYCDVKPKIVKSLSFGLLQHKTANWQVDLSGKFETVSDPTELSRILELTFRDWTKQLSKHDLKLVCDSFFDSLIASGITSLNAFPFDEKSFTHFFQVITSLRSIDQAKKVIILKSMRQLIHDYTGYRKREVTDKIQKHISQLLKLKSSKKL
ncbi:Mbeg1-like protein [Streptococcus catagoni]|uniref:Mbeg1-like protein n=1 Tax=Streptococcus catagoni TaxID=2654874 RepID=UPI00140A3150|nr:Mbeg1-like protein [Streptococcus catagoni]